MNQIHKIWILLPLIFILSCSQPGKREGEKAVEKKPPRERGYVSLFVKFQEGEERAFPEIPWREGQSVYEIMKQVEADIITMQVIDTLYGDMGHLILGFNQVRNQNPKFWVYCINGMKANMGVDDYPLKSGDRITWHYTSDMNPCEEDKDEEI
jgi:hypothetical protein